MKRLLIGTLALLACASLVLPGSASALTVSPARIEMEGAAGSSASGEFTIINEEAQAKTYYFSAQNFEAQGETGAPSFVDAQEGLATWIHVPAQITLQPRQTLKVPFTVDVPAGQEPGGNFAAIFLSTVAPGSTDTTQVSVGAKIGVLVLFRVSGDVAENGALLEFGTKDKQTFYTSLPVSFYYRFRNEGGDRVMPQGAIKVRDLVWLPAATLDANASQGNVLPDSIRRFETVWGPVLQQGDALHRGFFGMALYELRNFAFGRYTAHLDIGYGEHGERVTAKTSFYVLPWQLLIITIILLAIILGGGSVVLRRYNRWIISRAGGRGR